MVFQLTGLKFFITVVCSFFYISVAAAMMPVDTAYVQDTFCSNQSLLIGNQIFDAANPNGTVVLAGAASDGGDSVILVNLLFLQPSVTVLDNTLCGGDTVWVNGTAYHAKFYLGEEIIEGGAANGCDSIIEIDLKFYPTVLDYQATICEGDTFFFNGTAYHALHPNGEEFIPGAGIGGCDSIIRISMQVLTPPFSIISDTLCPDDVIMINGHRYDRDNRSGLEILPAAAANGCDSLVYLSLSFRELWVYLGEDREVIRGDTFCIWPVLGLMPQNFSWTPSPSLPCSEPDCKHICDQALADVSIQLTVTDTSGCVLTDEIRITISDENHVYAPNVFNPDANWPNNRFFLSTDKGVTNIRRLLVADRWGEIMFDQKNFPPDDSASGWDGIWRGKTAQTGVYTYWAELERFDGITFTKAGTFTLIR